MIEIIYRNIFLSVYTWVWASSLHAMILHPWRRTCWCVLRAVLEEFKPYCRSFLAILVVDLMPLVNGTSQWSKDTESIKLWFFSLLLLFTENKVFLCNWCKDWQSKTRVFLLTRQMLALTATVLTVLKATTQDQRVLCVCCYLLMVIMMRKYAVTLELFGRKTPSYAHLIIAIAYFSPPTRVVPSDNPPWQQFDKK